MGYDAERKCIDCGLRSEWDTFCVLCQRYRDGYRDGCATTLAAVRDAMNAAIAHPERHVPEGTKL